MNAPYEIMRGYIRWLKDHQKTQEDVAEFGKWLITWTETQNQMFDVSGATRNEMLMGALSCEMHKVLLHSLVELGPERLEYHFSVRPFLLTVANVLKNASPAYDNEDCWCHNAIGMWTILYTKAKLTINGHEPEMVYQGELLRGCAAVAEYSGIAEPEVAHLFAPRRSDTVYNASARLREYLEANK